jgi:hypothetical protein
LKTKERKISAWLHTIYGNDGSGNGQPIYDASNRKYNASFPEEKREIECKRRQNRKEHQHSS